MKVSNRTNNNNDNNNNNKMGHQQTKSGSGLRILSLTVIILMVAQFSLQTNQANLNPVLNINETFPYLIDPNTNQVIQPRDYMDFENLYSPNDTYKAKQTIQGQNYYMLKAFDFANYYQSDYWHYSSEEDLKNSALPVANELKCAKQLNWLERQIINSTASLFKPGEQHVQLATMVDSFGRPEANTYLGHGYWLGSYYECNRISIDFDKFEAEECANSPLCRVTSNSSLVAASQSQRVSPMRTRYCIGKAREIDWPEDNYVPRVSYKVGLCLPETCQTLSISKHKRQIERLMRFNMPDFMRERIILDDMYCLPDKRSPVREITLAGRIFLALLASWLIALLVATSLYSCLRRHQEDLRHLAQQMRSADLKANSGLPINLELASLEQQQQQHQLSIGLTMGENFETPPQSSSASSSSSSPPPSPPSVIDRQKSYLVNYIIHQSNQATTGGTNAIGSKLAEAPTSLMISSNSKHEEATKNLHQSPQPAPQVDNIESSASKVANTTIEPPFNRVGDHNQLDSQSQTSYNSSSSSLSAWLRDSPLIIRGLQAMSITENIREFQEPPKMLKNPGANMRLRINLNAMDAIKCLCCIMVIFGHIVFIHMQHLTNIVHTIELSNEVPPRILIAFFNFVDTFFIISGMLTAYFIFKRFNKRSFANPIIWLYISLLRLIRLTPVYLLVFWFAKTVTVHLADGPIWDYGTDKNSIKGLCQNDHWWKSLLYLGNYGTMQPLCILPAWSIIIDAQLSLFVPPILFLIFRHKRLGYLSLLVAVVISTASMSHQLANQTAVKTSDMAKIRLHVYPLISRFAAEFYNTTWNRLSAISIGILGGHMLYLYDIGHIRRWPYFMRGAYFKFILILHMLIFILPTISRFTDNPEAPTAAPTGSAEPDILLFVISNATIKPIWSIINTVFLLRLITDLRTHSVMARLMSHNIWHCLGKLCFASYLVHYEIILILLKSRQEGQLDPNWWNVMREFSAAFLISTLVAYLVYILFEAPINKLIMLNVDKSNLVKEQQTSLKSIGNIAKVPDQHGINDDSSNREEVNDNDAPNGYHCKLSSSLNHHPVKISRSSSATSDSNNRRQRDDYRYDCIGGKHSNVDLSNIT